jgi:hypothetical protein
LPPMWPTPLSKCIRSSRLRARVKSSGESIGAF